MHASKIYKKKTPLVNSEARIKFCEELLINLNSFANILQNIKKKLHTIYHHVTEEKDAHLRKALEDCIVAMPLVNYDQVDDVTVPFSDTGDNADKIIHSEKLHSEGIWLPDKRQELNTLFGVIPHFVKDHQETAPHWTSLAHIISDKVLCLLFEKTTQKDSPDKDLIQTMEHFVLHCQRYSSSALKDSIVSYWMNAKLTCEIQEFIVNIKRIHTVIVTNSLQKKYNTTIAELYVECLLDLVHLFQTLRYPCEDQKENYMSYVDIDWRTPKILLSHTVSIFPALYQVLSDLKTTHAQQPWFIKAVGLCVLPSLDPEKRQEECREITNMITSWHHDLKQPGNARAEKKIANLMQTTSQLLQVLFESIPPQETDYDDPFFYILGKQVVVAPKTPTSSVPPHISTENLKLYELAIMRSHLELESVLREKEERLLSELREHLRKEEMIIQLEAKNQETIRQTGNPADLENLVEISSIIEKLVQDRAGRVANMHAIKKIAGAFEGSSSEIRPPQTPETNADQLIISVKKFLHSSYSEALKDQFKECIPDLNDHMLESYIELSEKASQTKRQLTEIRGAQIKLRDLDGKIAQTVFQTLDTNIKKLIQNLYEQQDACKKINANEEQLFQHFKEIINNIETYCDNIAASSSPDLFFTHTLKNLCERVYTHYPARYFPDQEMYDQFNAPVYADSQVQPSACYENTFKKPREGDVRKQSPWRLLSEKDFSLSSAPPESNDKIREILDLAKEPFGEISVEAQEKKQEIDHSKRTFGKELPEQAYCETGQASHEEKSLSIGERRVSLEEKVASILENEQVRIEVCQKLLTGIALLKAQKVGHHTLLYRLEELVEQQAASSASEITPEYENEISAFKSAVLAPQKQNESQQNIRKTFEAIQACYPKCEYSIQLQQPFTTQLTDKDVGAHILSTPIAPAPECDAINHEFSQDVDCLSSELIRSRFFYAIQLTLHELITDGKAIGSSSRLPEAVCKQIDEYLWFISDPEQTKTLEKLGKLHAQFKANLNAGDLRHQIIDLKKATVHTNGHFFNADMKLEYSQVIMYTLRGYLDTTAHTTNINLPILQKMARQGHAATVWQYILYEACTNAMLTQIKYLRKHKESIKKPQRLSTWPNKILSVLQNMITITSAQVTLNNTLNSLINNTLCTSDEKTFTGLMDAITTLEEITRAYHYHSKYTAGQVPQINIYASMSKTPKFRQSHIYPHTNTLPRNALESKMQLCEIQWHFISGRFTPQDQYCHQKDPLFCTLYKLLYKDDATSFFTLSHQILDELIENFLDRKFDRKQTIRYTSQWISTQKENIEILLGLIEETESSLTFTIHAYTIIKKLGEISKERLQLGSIKNTQKKIEHIVKVESDNLDSASQDILKQLHNSILALTGKPQDTPSGTWSETIKHINASIVQLIDRDKIRRLSSKEYFMIDKFPVSLLRALPETFPVDSNTQYEMSEILKSFTDFLQKLSYNETIIAPGRIMERWGTDALNLRTKVEKYAEPKLESENTKKDSQAVPRALKISDQHEKSVRAEKYLQAVPKALEALDQHRKNVCIVKKFYVQALNYARHIDNLRMSELASDKRSYTNGQLKVNLKSKLTIDEISPERDTEKLIKGIISTILNTIHLNELYEFNVRDLIEKNNLYAAYIENQKLLPVLRDFHSTQLRSDEALQSRSPDFDEFCKNVSDSLKLLNISNENKRLIAGRIGTVMAHAKEANVKSFLDELKDCFGEIHGILQARLDSKSELLGRIADAIEMNTLYTHLKSKLKEIVQTAVKYTAGKPSLQISKHPDDLFMSVFEEVTSEPFTEVTIEDAIEEPSLVKTTTKEPFRLQFKENWTPFEKKASISVNTQNEKLQEILQRIAIGDYFCNSKDTENLSGSEDTFKQTVSTDIPEHELEQYLKENECRFIDHGEQYTLMGPTLSSIHLVENFLTELSEETSHTIYIVSDDYFTLLDTALVFKQVYHTTKCKKQISIKLELPAPPQRGQNHLFDPMIEMSSLNHPFSIVYKDASIAPIFNTPNTIDTVANLDEFALEEDQKNFIRDLFQCKHASEVITLLAALNADDIIYQRDDNHTKHRTFKVCETQRPYVDTVIAQISNAGKMILTACSRASWPRVLELESLFSPHKNAYAATMNPANSEQCIFISRVSDTGLLGSNPYGFFVHKDIIHASLKIDNNTPHCKQKANAYISNLLRELIVVISTEINPYTREPLDEIYKAMSSPKPQKNISWDGKPLSSLCDNILESFGLDEHREFQRYVYPHFNDAEERSISTDIDSIITNLKELNYLQPLSRNEFYRKLSELRSTATSRMLSSSPDSFFYIWPILINREITSTQGQYVEPLNLSSFALQKKNYEEHYSKSSSSTLDKIRYAQHVLFGWGASTRIFDVIGSLVDAYGLIYNSSEESNLRLKEEVELSLIHCVAFEDIDITYNTNELTRTIVLHKTHQTSADRQSYQTKVLSELYEDLDSWSFPLENHLERLKELYDRGHIYAGILRAQILLSSEFKSIQRCRPDPQAGASLLRDIINHHPEALCAKMLLGACYMAGVGLVKNIPKGRALISELNFSTPNETGACEKLGHTLLKKDYLRWEIGRFSYSLITQTPTTEPPMTLKSEVLAFINDNCKYFMKPELTTRGFLITVQFPNESNTQRDRRLCSILQLGVILAQLKEKNIPTKIQDDVKYALKHEVERLNELSQERLCFLFSFDIGKELLINEFTLKTHSGSKTKSPPSQPWLQRIFNL